MRSIFPVFDRGVQPALVDLGSVCVVYCKHKVRHFYFILLPAGPPPPLIELDNIQKTEKKKKQVTFHPKV
jgi:hypothetical protein